MERYAVFVPRLLPREESLAPGHRACQGCGLAVAVRLVSKAFGSNVILVNATGCLEIISTPYPFTSWRVPWIHTLFENTAAVASGVVAALEVLQRKGRDVPQGTRVVAFAGDGGTADIGLQALSGALERGHRLTYVCFDNEAYMNTGIQRSGSTPYGAMTTTSPPGKRSIGQRTWKKDMPAIAVAHNIPYVATATIGYPFDLMEKARRAAQVDGPSYLHVFAPCPTGWRLPPRLAVRISRLAVHTGVFPLYEVVEGRYRLSVKPARLRPVAEYLSLQGRFRHLPPEEISRIQQRVEDRWRELVRRAELDGGT